jgi:hypothetical protein
MESRDAYRTPSSYEYNYGNLYKNHELCSMGHFGHRRLQKRVGTDENISQMLSLLYL